jgi:hypothetical protein
MMLGGAIDSIAQPIDNCVVPDGIDGLVYVYITKSNQPLLNDLTVQFQADIVAGPLGVFIDTNSDRLAELISSSPIGGNPAFTSNNNDTSPSNDPSTTTATDGGPSTFTTTSTLPASEASSLVASGSTPTFTGTPSNAGGDPNTNTGDMGGADVIGWSSVPVTTPTASPARRNVNRKSPSRRRL